MNAGVVGGLLGAVFGIGGGAIGTYLSIRNTSGPLERTYVTKAAALTWIAISLFVVLMLVAPSSYRFWLWILYGMSLLFSIKKINSRIERIREIEIST